MDNITSCVDNIVHDVINIMHRGPNLAWHAWRARETCVSSDFDRKSCPSACNSGMWARVRCVKRRENMRKPCAKCSKGENIADAQEKTGSFRLLFQTKSGVLRSSFTAMRHACDSLCTCACVPGSDSSASPWGLVPHGIHCLEHKAHSITHMCHATCTHTSHHAPSTGPPCVWVVCTWRHTRACRYVCVRFCMMHACMHARARTRGRQAAMNRSTSHLAHAHSAICEQPNGPRPAPFQHTRPSTNAMC